MVKQTLHYSSIMLDGGFITAFPYFERLLELEFSPNRIDISRLFLKIVGKRLILSLQLVSRKLYLQSQNRPKTVSSSYISYRLSQFSLAFIDRIKNRLRIPVGDELFSFLKLISYKLNVARPLLLCRNFHKTRADELHFLPPNTQSFEIRNRYAISSIFVFLEKEVSFIWISSAQNCCFVDGV